MDKQKKIDEWTPLFLTRHARIYKVKGISFNYSLNIYDSKSLKEIS